MTEVSKVLTTFDGAAAPGGFAFTEMLIPVAIFLTVWYLLVLRPQTAERDQREAMLAALSKGDEVISSGGLFGTIIEIEADVLTVELADKVRVRMERSAVARKQGDPAVRK